MGPTVGAEDGLSLGSGVGELSVAKVRSRTTGVSISPRTASLKVTEEPDTDTTVVPSAMLPAVDEVTLAPEGIVEATLLDETTTTVEPDVALAVAVTATADE